MRSRIARTCSISIFCVSILAVQAHAQVQPSAKASNGAGQSQTFMILIALLLAFVIWGLGQVLTTLGRQALEKNKKQSRIFAVLLLIGATFLSQLTYAQETPTASKLSTMTLSGGMNSTSFWLLTIVIALELVIIAFMLFMIRRIRTELMPVKQVTHPLLRRSWWSTLDKKLFTRAVSVEKEADILLDHDYDGIRELDNSLPPWWKYGFIVTVIIGFIYMLNFHVLGYGKNPTEEYQQEMAEAHKARQAYEAKNKDKIDESNLKMPDENGLAAGKDIFTSTCWACHGKLGEGGAGPNLTDDYWLYKGSLQDIYASIKHGYPDKGMQAWEKNFSPREINNIAGYIKTLRGTNPPNAKAPQGELFAEATGDSTSSRSTNPDSLSTTMLKN